jgi:hypothetical protein
VSCFDQHDITYSCGGVTWGASGGKIDERGLFVAEAVGRSRYARLCTWVCLVAPLAATITVPFFVAPFSAGFDSTFYLALREYGLPTAAAVNVLVVGIAVTIHPQSVDLRKGLFGCTSNPT